MRAPNSSWTVGQSGISSAVRPFVRAERPRKGRMVSKMTSKTARRCRMVLFSHGLGSEKVRCVRGRRAADDPDGSDGAFDASQGVDAGKRFQKDIQKIHVQEFRRSDGVCQYDNADSGARRT